MFETTVAGSLPKPLWLAEPEKLWPAWKLEGDALAAGKIDATILAVKRQEDAGIDIVSDGEQARIHFVHGFLANLDGIDFARRQTIGIRADRYKAEVPTVTGPIRRKGPVHKLEASAARAHTKRKLKFTLPGPMTIVDTVADKFYGDRAAQFEDPFGHRWNVSTHVEDVSPEQMSERAAAELGWRPETGFVDGARRYVDWLTETHPVSRAATASSTLGNAAAVFRQEPGEL